jgi:hypothetical protein
MTGNVVAPSYNSRNFHLIVVVVVVVVVVAT